jgi:hypothetical protein
MKVLRAAAVIALLTGPAFAQAPHINMMPEIASKTPEEKEADAARDKAYKESLKKIPDAKAPSDPWGNVRVDPPKASASAAARPAVKPRTKTATNPN